MGATQCTSHLPIQVDMQAIRPRARRPGPGRGGAQGWMLVVVAHLASLLSVGALVIGLTFGSIAAAKRCIGDGAAHGQAATAPDEDGGSRAGATQASTWSSR